MFYPGMFSPPVWYEVLWSACLCMCVSFSVCLFVRLRVSKPHVQILLNIPYMIDVAVARSSSDGYAIHYVLPVLWMTSCFHMMQGIGHNQRWHVGFAQYATWRISHTSDVLFGGDRQVAAPGGEVCLSDCILFVQCILFDWPPFFLSVTPLGTWGFWQSEFRVRWTVWTRVVASVGLKILPFSNSLLYEWRKYYSWPERLKTVLSYVSYITKLILTLTYRRIAQVVDDCPSASFREVDLLSSGSEPQRVGQWADVWQLLTVELSRSPPATRVNVHSDRFESVLGMCRLDDVRTRR